MACQITVQGHTHHVFKDAAALVGHRPRGWQHGSILPRCAAQAHQRLQPIDVSAHLVQTVDAQANGGQVEDQDGNGHPEIPEGRAKTPPSPGGGCSLLSLDGGGGCNGVGLWGHLQAPACHPWCWAWAAALLCCLIRGAAVVSELGWTCRNAALMCSKAAEQRPSAIPVRERRSGQVASQKTEQQPASVTACARHFLHAGHFSQPVRCRVHAAPICTMN